MPTRSRGTGPRQFSMKDLADARRKGATLGNEELASGLRNVRDGSLRP